MNKYLFFRYLDMCRGADMGLKVFPELDDSMRLALVKEWQRRSPYAPGISIAEGVRRHKSRYSRQVQKNTGVRPQE